MRSLARAGAFLPFGTGRRDALWEILGSARETVPDASAHGLSTRELLEEEEPMTRFAPLPPFDEILWDYSASIHSARGHPLETLREEIARWGLPDARGVAALPDGSAVRCLGLVICRQRPGTAGGTVFLTLEDETGLINLIVWKNVYQRYRTVILMTSCLGVTGKVQSRDGVVHVLVQTCFVPRFSRPPVDPGSRDFH